MSKYVYPAVFEPDYENGGYCVHFPDFENCSSYGGITTQGDDFQHAMKMAEDALCLALYTLERDDKEIPSPSESSYIVTEPNCIVNLVACDTRFYKNYFESKAVKINVTLPLWLKEEAEKKHVNFSQILQKGVKDYLSIK